MSVKAPGIRKGAAGPLRVRFIAPLGPRSAGQNQNVFFLAGG